MSYKGLGIQWSREFFFFAPIVSIKVFYFRLMPSFTYYNKKTPYQIRKIHLKPANWTSMKWRVRQGLCTSEVMAFVDAQKEVYIHIYMHYTFVWTKMQVFLHMLCFTKNLLINWYTGSKLTKFTTLKASCKKAKSFMVFW